MKLKYLSILIALALASCISEYDIPPENWTDLYIKPDSIGDQVWMGNDMDYNSNESLYNWTSAMSICPTGWRLPKKQDWDALEDVSNFSSGGYWSDSTADEDYPDKAYVFYSRNGRMEQRAEYKTEFYSVRCIENTDDDNVCCVMDGPPFKTDSETCMLLGSITGKECE